jgi:Glycosyltransferase family 87
LFHRLRSWWQTRTLWEQAAVALWTIALIVVSIRVVAAPRARTVYPIFAESARQWWSGGPMYAPHRPLELQGGYRYSPAFAILMTPFALLPDGIGGVVWRLFMTGIFLGALGWFARSVLPRPLTRTQTALLFLFVFPLSLASVSNGQVNVLIIGVILAAAAGAKAGRWNLVALCMALVFLFKVYPLAVGLLLVLLYPRQLGPRLAVAMIAGLALPFALQHPEYVAGQYHDWIECVRVDDRSMLPLPDAYRDLWLLIRVFEVPIAHSIYEVMQFAAAAGIAGLCLAMKRRGWPERDMLTALVALAACWMMLLGPATESCTYILLAPTLAWAVLESWIMPRSWLVRGLLVLSCALFMTSRVASWFPFVTQWHGLGVHPLGTLALLACVLIEQIRGPARASTFVKVEPAAPAARAA